MVFVQELKASGFEHHNHMSYVWNGPFWTTNHSQGMGGWLLLCHPTFIILLEGMVLIETTVVCGSLFFSKKDCLDFAPFILPIRVFLGHTFGIG